MQDEAISVICLPIQQFEVEMFTNGKFKRYSVMEKYSPKTPHLQLGTWVSTSYIPLHLPLSLGSLPPPLHVEASMAVQIHYVNVRKERETFPPQSLARN